MSENQPAEENKTPLEGSNSQQNLNNSQPTTQQQLQGGPLNNQQPGGPGPMQGGPGPNMQGGPQGGPPPLQLVKGPNGQPMFRAPNGQLIPAVPGPNGQPVPAPMMRPGPGGPGPMQMHPGMPGPGGQMRPGMPGPGGPPRPQGPPRQVPIESKPFDVEAMKAQAKEGQAGDESKGAYGSVQECQGKCSGFCGAYICPCCCTSPFQIIPEGFSGIVMRFDKYFKTHSPGMYYINPEIDKVELIDKRERTVDLRRQNVVTKDNMNLRIDAVLFYKIFDSLRARFAVSNLQAQIQDLAITTMRNVVGGMTMQEFLEKKDGVDEKIEDEIGVPASNWGVKVTHVLVQDAVLPPEFRATMSAGAIQKRIAEAKVITAQADVHAAKLQREAAEALSTDAALQIRYLDALEILAKTGNPKLIFFPSDYREIGTANQHLDSQVKKLM